MTMLLYKKNNKISTLKMIYFMTLIMSTLIAINSLSWFNAWMGMEINLMSFIPLMMNKTKKNKTSNSMMIYFIIQASASSMMLMMIIMYKMQLNLNKTNMIMGFIQMSLLMKLGASPLHWWIPKVLNNLTWMNCSILLTWQKIAPMFILSSSMNNNFIIYLTALISVYMGAMMGMNQTSLKMIMVYSSINHLGWLLMTLLMNESLMIMYFLVYSIITYLICLMLNNTNVYYMNQLFLNNNNNLIMKMIKMSLFLSLAGLPPMMGALPKLSTLMLMINNNMIMESLLFIIMAVVSLSFYMNPLLSIFIFNKNNFKFNNKNNYIYMNMFSIIMINIIMMIIIFYSYII